MKLDLILCTTATPGRRDFPKDDIAEAFKRLLKTVVNFTPDCFRMLDEEWRSSHMRATQSGHLIKLRLFEIERDRKIFGSGPTIEIDGITYIGVEMRLTVGSRLAVAMLKTRVPPNLREKAVDLLPAIKAIILSYCPDASFKDVIS